MIEQTSNECPEPDVIEQFLRGNLHPPQLDHFESHLKDCEHCHETLAGLNGEDTLTERLVEVLQHGDSADVEGSLVEEPGDSAEIKNLLGRLTSDDFKRSAMAAGPESGHRSRTAQMEMVADRAAEILRCVTPDEESLGILGDYKMVRLIGAGSTGVVFQALDQTLNRTVALKVLRPSLGEAARTRFLTEAKLAASIEHVNVVTIFQVGQVDRLAFMAMQWLPGQTLDDLLSSKEQLSDDQIVEIIRQVATGLNAAHQKQLVHRDIKPANLWICEEDRQLKLLDFGLARINDGNHNLTATGMLAGTPGFMSPEQTRGLELDGRSDLFSLGCVLYRLLAGQLPFDAPSILATLSSIQSDHPVAPVKIDSKADQDLSDLAMCLLEKRPEDRPQSASQVVELLTTPREQWSLQVPTHSNSLRHAGNRQPKTATMAANGSGRKWSTWFAALVGLLMLGTFGWLFKAQIIRIATDQGEVVIETSDDNVEVQVVQAGQILRVIDTKTQQSFSLKSGQYSFNAVATDPDKESANSFTIKPETLTMKRGETAIVSVTVRPKKNVDPQVGSVVKKQLVYQGKTFDQWITTLKSDRDPRVQSSAIEAGLAIMETEHEQRQILEGTLEFTKTLDRKFGARKFSSSYIDAYRRAREGSENKDIPQFNDLILRVFKSCDQTLVLDLLKSAIESGTPTSQQVCSNWLATAAGQTLFFDRYEELEDTFAENFTKPGVRKIATSLMDDATLQGETLTQFRESTLGKKIEAFVQTATPEQRYEVLYLAFEIFPDEQQVLQTYQKDLLDPNLNNPKVRQKLFEFMINEISNVEYYEAQSVDATTRQQRLATATDWLAKGMEVNLAIEDRQSVFDRDARYRIIVSSEVTQQMLQSFYDIGSRSNDPKITQRLLPELEKLKELITQETRDINSKRPPRLLADVDYVIAVFQGNTPAKRPFGSKLKISAIASVTPDEKKESAPKAEPITMNKPAFEGNTFEQWINILRSNQEYKAQAKALEACLTIMDTELEQEQVLDGARAFIDTLDRKFGYSAFSKASLLSYQNSSGLAKDHPSSEKKAALVHCHELLLRVLNSCNRQLVFDFFKTEIETGTRLGQQICLNWLRSFDISSAVVYDRYTELLDPFAENFDKPLVRAMAEYLVPRASFDHQPLTKIQESALGARVKEFVQTATAVERLEVLLLAFGIFPDDQQLLQTYQKDMLDPKLNDVFADLRSIGLSIRLATFARGKLFSFMLNFVANKDYYEAPNLDANTQKRRLAVAADWLAKVVDRHLADGDQNIVVAADWIIVNNGERQIRPINTSNLAEEVLPCFYDIGIRHNDLKVKQLLLPRLEALKDSLAEEEWIRKAEGKLSNADQKRRKQPLADLEYVIAVYEGNTPKELPPNSYLNKPPAPALFPVAKDKPVVESESITKKNPASEGNAETFEGKTLTEWRKVLETNQDAFKQAKAMKACTAFLASNDRKEELDAMLQKFLSQRAPLSSFGQDDDEYIRFLGFAEAFGKLSPVRTVEFLKLQLKEGGEIPLEWTFKALFARRVSRSSRALKNELKSKAGELLTLISNRKKEGSVNYIFEFIVKRVLEKPLTVDSLDAIRSVLIALTPMDLFKAVEFVPEHLVTADLFVSTKTKLLAKETSTKERDELIEALMKLDDNIYRKTNVPVNEVYAALLVNQLFDTTPVEFDEFQEMKIYTKKTSDGVEYRSIEASVTTPRGFTKIEIKDPTVVPRKLLNKICERLLIKKQKNPQAAAAKIYSKIANASSNGEDLSRNRSELFKTLEIERDLDALNKLADKKHGEFSEYPNHWIKRKF